MSLFAHTKKHHEHEYHKPLEIPAWEPWTQKINEVLAPTTGTARPLSDSEDVLFSNGKVGTGVILEPAGELICSPVNGEVLMVFPTRSAISIADEQGREVLLHLGMGTSKLKGKPFICYVKPGDRVQAGQPLIKADWSAVKAAGLPSELGVVLPKKESVTQPAKGWIEQGKVLFTIGPAA